MPWGLILAPDPWNPPRRTLVLWTTAVRSNGVSALDKTTPGVSFSDDGDTHVVINEEKGGVLYHWVSAPVRRSETQTFLDFSAALSDWSLLPRGSV